MIIPPLLLAPSQRLCDMRVAAPLAAVCATLLFTAATQSGYIDPNSIGGSQFAQFNPEEREPLNVIISGMSSKDVLSNIGFHDYMSGLGFWEECAGIHIGNKQAANLDGTGYKNQSEVLRYNRVPVAGSCIESVVGGNHLRWWRQESSGAYFLAVSVEEDFTEHHNIVDDGYNKGRDQLVDSATKDVRTLLGSYATTVDYVEDLLPAGSDRLNHGIPQDGRVAVLKVDFARAF